MSIPLVIVGPTASGKSDVAMAYARTHSSCEIVAVDAMQVYCGMDVGTAKPSAQDRADVPHHCLDLADPSDEFAVADFVGAANEALEAISRRGGRAVLVAGTGLYLRAVTDPMEIPGRWPEIRAELEARAAAVGPEALHAELAEADPLAASRMEPSNERRVVRALEVVLGSGRAFSSFGPGLDTYPQVAFVQVGILWPRPVLADRIARRVHAMVAAGLVAEVERLLTDPRGLSRTARQALGYKEIIDHLEGRCSLDEAVDTVILRTRQFAVRQERWFRRDPRIRWVHVEHDPVAEVLPVLEDS
ncbi:MAG TPA: tRNA (adenosine(37)-N6)-dimethylallyltransferase MiaA [Ilumatobacteraceae bacterium]|nr:tRNA (adenosine(37)-N6)-dimethylallyltransferase MiaA [Ilumatobacteraceae bacterium]